MYHACPVHVSLANQTILRSGNKGEEMVAVARVWNGICGKIQWNEEIWVGERDEERRKKKVEGKDGGKKKGL